MTKFKVTTETRNNREADSCMCSHLEAAGAAVVEVGGREGVPPKAAAGALQFKASAR